jgi:hypothetical protein
MGSEMNATPLRAPRGFSQVLAVLPLVSPPAPRAEEVPFRELAASFLEAHCPKDATPLTCPLESVIAAEFAIVRLGAFELAFPLGFFGDARRAEIQLLSRAALDLQERWMARFALDPGTAEAARAEIEVLRAWVDGWSKNDLGGVARGGGGDLLDLLGAEPAVRGASQRLAPMPFAAGKLALAPQFTDRIRLLLAPTRREFMELVGYVGLLLPARQSDLWQPGVTDWTQFWVDKTVVVALQYAPWEDDPKFRTGLPMNKFDKDGLRQHFVQQAAGALLFTSLNRTDMPLFEKGLALDLTIELCGRANTIDGEGAISSTGASTAPYERFVPGGNSAGGTLPPIPAAPFDAITENHWRRGGGADRFAAVLRDGQEDGAKRAQKERESPLWKNELAHFELQSEEGQRCLVSAPFLGKPSKEKPYPAAGYLNDLREFYRSYQGCFLDWLERCGAGDAAASHAKLNALLRKVAAPGRPSLDDAVAEVYGVPLSTSSPSEALEWRFLAWLANPD